MSSLVLTVVFIEKLIRAGSRKQVLGGLIEDLPLPGNHPQDNRHPTEAVQILIAITHHANEVRPRQIITEIRVVPAAEIKDMVAVEGQEVLAAEVQGAAEVGVVEEEGDLLFTVKY